VRDIALTTTLTTETWQAGASAKPRTRIGTPAPDRDPDE
jgi:hypothetical protein